MPDSLTVLVGISSIIAVILSGYTIIDGKLGGKRKEITGIKEKLADHETRIVAIERVTKVVDEFMEDLLLENLRNKKRRQ